MARSSCPIVSACGMSRSSLAAPIWLMLCAASGMLLGYQLQQRPFLGLALGALAGNLPFVLLGAGHGVLLAWRPERPRCRCGRCRSEQYEFTGAEGRASGSIIFRYRCPACGRRYGRMGSRFLELESGGSGSIYMKLSCVGRWVREKAGDRPAPAPQAPQMHAALSCRAAERPCDRSHPAARSGRS